MKRRSCMTGVKNCAKLRNETENISTQGKICMVATGLPVDFVQVVGKRLPKADIPLPSGIQKHLEEKTK